MREPAVMEGFVFRRRDGTGVKIGSEALVQLLAFRQVEPHQDEAGGVLLGRHILGCRDIVIDEVTVPMPGDRRMRLGFHRSQAPHQRVIDERWMTSRGTCQYLGEWHTHPESTPTPSRIDLDDWRRRLHVDHFEGDSLLFIIVGTHEVRVWEGNRRHRGMDRLMPCTSLGPHI